jgi:hypothetical protein
MQKHSVESLETRIAAALRTQPPSSDVAALIAETKQAAQAAEQAADKARSVALDPTLTRAQINGARAAMDDALFSRDRANAAVSRLDIRLKELHQIEEQARRRQAYDAAKEERDKLAAELRDLYPQFVPKLADVLTRIVANDDVIKHIDEQLPEGASRLSSAEAIARGFTDGGHTFVEQGITINRITDGVKLPGWGKSQRSFYGN